MSLRVTCLCLAAALFAPPLALTARPADSTAAAPDSAVSVVRRDSLLVPDSSFSDYLMRREHFSYPATSRHDPFDSPFGKKIADVMAGPSLSDMELTGVLYSPAGLSVAIMSLPTGSSFLLHEGDYVGDAEVSRIDKSSIHFQIREYGTIRTLVKELKPLVEGNNGKSPEQAGSGDRQQESQPASGEGGGPAPRK